MKVVVDAFGGDNAPLEVVEGAILAIKENKDLNVVLCGDENKIKEILNGNVDRKIIISHCYAEDEAEELKYHIEKLCGKQNIKIIPMRALTSYYALEKGVIVCF